MTERGQRVMAHSSEPWIGESDVFSIFPTFVWKVRLEPALAARINGAIRESLHATEPRLATLPRGEAWQSQHGLHTLDAYGELVQSIDRATGTVLRFLRSGYRAIALTGCWANVNAPGAGHAMHSHPNNFLSGAYYVQTRPGADTINFHDPRPQAGIMRPPVTELTSQNTDQVVVQVSAGTLLMFPAWLPHSVAPNASEAARISISFNLMFASYAENLGRPLWEPERDDSA